MKIQNNKEKTATTIIIALAIGLVLLSPTITMPDINAQKQPVNPHMSLSSQIQHISPHHNMPRPPSKVGCYHYSEKTGWETTTCMSDEMVKKLHLANEGGSYGTHGIDDTSDSNLNFGEVQIDLSTFSGESDSRSGSGAFSIQDNTNNFTGSNFDTDWVQFLAQDIPNTAAGVCIEQWDLSTNTVIDDKCATIPQQTLNQGYAPYVDGSTGSSGGTATLTANFCSTQTNSSGQDCWAITRDDYDGLAGNWNEVTGTILGEGDGSNADFTSHATEYTTITASEPSAYTPSIGWADQTAETNNLNYQPSYTSTSCDGSGDCYAYIKETN